MQQDEQESEVVAADSATEAPTNQAPSPAKKGAKQADSKPTSAEFAALVKRMDRHDSLLKAIQLAQIGLEQRVEKALGGFHAEFEIVRTVTADTNSRMEQRQKATQVEYARLYEAVTRNEISTQKALEATVAACEILAATTPQNASTVRKVVAELKARSAKKLPETRSVPAVGKPWWQGKWAILAVFVGTVVALAALLR